MDEDIGGKRLGDWGEHKAAEYLQRRGYQIIERNFRCCVGEVDLIAQNGDVVVFVEVKTRRSCAFGLPCEAVTIKKQRRLRQSAAFYISLKKLQDCIVRMDVIELLHQEGKWYFRHLEDAL